MLMINMEFRKGILFVRLKGILTKDTVNKLNKEVLELIKNNGIRNVVINIKELKAIDTKGINSLFYLYELSNRYKGTSLICGIDDEKIMVKIKKSRLIKYMHKVDTELTAINLITI